MRHWISEHHALLWWASAGSVVLFVAGLFLAPALLVRIPRDYFSHERRPPGRFAGSPPLIRVAALVCKNALGLVLLLLGVVMLALPGPGLLTALIGFLLLDWPGKYRFEKWVASRRRVRNAINWVRKRAGREPMA